MLKVKLYDDFFSHESSTTPSLTPKYWQYIDSVLDADIELYSHNRILNALALPYNVYQKHSYGLIFESYAIIPQIYDAIVNSYNQNPHLFERFKAIFTYSKTLLDLNPNLFKYCPANEPWVGTPWGGGERKIYEKTQLCSMVSSNKSFTPTQLRRTSLAQFLYKNSLADVFGTAVNYPIEKIAAGIAPYKFSIAIENNSEENYFTEKLTNCFACGTIPIYYGCPNISSFFDDRGIINLANFNSTHDLFEYITQPNLYETMLPFAQINLERIKNNTCIEDFIHVNYLHS